MSRPAFKLSFRLVLTDIDNLISIIGTCSSFRTLENEKNRVICSAAELDSHNVIIRIADSGAQFVGDRLF